MADPNDPKAKFLFPNLTYIAALKGGSWRTGDFSLDALKDPLIGRPARSTNAAVGSTVVDLDLDRPREVGGVVALNHNMTVQAKMIVQGFRDAERTDPIFNAEGESTQVYPPLYHTRDLPWSHPNWFSGRPLREDIGLTTSTAISLFDQNRSIMYWRVSFVDPNNPAGYLDIGKLILAPAFDPPHNYDYGATLTVVDESRMSQSLSGARFYDKRGKRRRMTMNFSVMKEGMEFSRFFDLNVKAGITEEIFVIPDPDDAINLQRRSFCAHIKEPSALEQLVKRHIGASYVFEEVI